MLSVNATGVTVEARALHQSVLDSHDLNWKKTEANRKFTVVADNCLTVYMSDPNDPYPLACTATKDFWFRNASWINVETRDMANNELPRTDGCKWIHEDHKFGNAG